MELLKTSVGAFQSNCYLLIGMGTREAILIDAGAKSAELESWTGLHPIQNVLLTHGHADHIGALDWVRSSTNAAVHVHPNDAQDFEIEADASLEHGVTIPLGAESIEVFHAPGHTRGSVIFLLHEIDGTNRAVVGDAIFPGGPGHTRSHQALRSALSSLQGTVFTWPDDIELHPGHGVSTTVGAERPGFEDLLAGELSADLFGDITWR